VSVDSYYVVVPEYYTMSVYTQQALLENSQEKCKSLIRRYGIYTNHGFHR
jgi:hypothetical protein